jgi:hypothetical protein
MIKVPTVFILGAGASKPYGYPLGFDLRVSICRDFVSTLKRAQEEGAIRDRQLISEAERFCDIFESSNTSSIDLFLSRNVKFADIGKSSIALNMLYAEKTSRFGIDVAPAEDWYSYLFEQMTDDLIEPSSFGRFGDNKVHFITFNYDRSLQHFLFQSLRHSFYDAADEDIEEQVKKIQVDHVYGAVAPLPWQGNGREYGREYSWDDIAGLAKNIQLMHQERKTAKVTEVIREASKIFFLGFGYHRENLQILGIGREDYGLKEIFGTGMGLSASKIDEITLLLKTAFTLTLPNSPSLFSNPSIDKCGCRELLSERL